MSGPSRREEQDRRSQQPVKRFSLKGLFNKLTGLRGIRALFNFFARSRGPRPVPIKIDPAWFPVPQPAAALPDVPNNHMASVSERSWEPPWMQAFASERERSDQSYDYASAEQESELADNLSEPEIDTITVRPGERLPLEAGELLRTYYAPGIGDMRVYSRIDPNDMEIDPGQMLDPDNPEPEASEPVKKPKSPK